MSEDSLRSAIARFYFSDSHHRMSPSQDAAVRSIPPSDSPGHYLTSAMRQQGNGHFCLYFRRQVEALRLHWFVLLLSFISKRVMSRVTGMKRSRMQSEIWLWGWGRTKRLLGHCKPFSLQSTLSREVLGEKAQEERSYL